MSVGLVHRELGGFPEITAIGMIGVARAEVAQEHLGHISLFAAVATRPGIGRCRLAEVAEGFASRFTRRQGRGLAPGNTGS